MFAARLATRVSGTVVHLGLVHDLARSPPAPARSHPVELRPERASGFHAFEERLETATGHDYFDVAWRSAMCADDVAVLYVARSSDGAPLFTQWLVAPAEQRRASTHFDGLRPPEAGDVLLEGAYVFPSARGQGVMRTAMSQVLEAAQREGFRRAWTYVDRRNAAALRSCAAVGFEPDHVRLKRWRFGRTSSERRPLDVVSLDAWREATDSPPRAEAARS